MAYELVFLNTKFIKASCAKKRGLKEVNTIFKNSLTNVIKSSKIHKQFIWGKSSDVNLLLFVS